MNVLVSRRSGRAFVLVGVLVVVMLMSMIALSLMFRMRSEETAGATGSGAEQAWAAAMSGVREATRVAAAIRPGELDWQDAPERFRDRVLYDDGAEEWRWTVYTGDGEGGLRFGLSDEAGKVNLNYATTSMVSRLPLMKPILADALLDFLDADDLPRPEGAEQEYYDALPHPYRIHNGPLATVEQLLLVRGFSPAVVFGEDANQNFTLDANEDDGDEKEPPDDQDGRLAQGLRPFVTVVSHESNRDNAGAARINLNSAKAELPGTNGLPAAFVAFVAELRASDSVVLHPAELLDATLKIKDKEGREREIPTGVGRDSIGLVLDRFTGSDEAELHGLVNVNTAGITVLQTVPGIDGALAEMIVSTRRNLAADRRNSVAWLHVENLVDAEKFREIAPFLTTRGRQFSFDVVGYGAKSGRFRVLEAVIDTDGPEPRLLYLRDITRLGLPFPLVSAEDGGGAQETPAGGPSGKPVKPATSTRRTSPRRRRGAGRRRIRRCVGIIPPERSSGVGDQPRRMAAFA